MTDTLLVVPAGTYQVDAVRTARRLGLRVVTADNRPDNPGHHLADARHLVSTADVPGVLEVARSEDVAGVIAPASDLALHAAAVVSNELGLRGPRPEVVRRLCSKTAFRECQDELGLPVPRWSRVREGEPIPGFDGPFTVVKPDDSSGGKGCRIVDGDAIPRALPGALAFSPTGVAVLEEYLEGEQFTVEGLLSDGRIAFEFVTRRLTAELPFVATHGHVHPAGLSPTVTHVVREQVESLFAAVGHRDGPFDGDFVVTERGPVLLELTPRVGGNHLARLVRVCTGVDVHEATIRSVLGESVEPTATRERAGAVLLLGSSECGRLEFDEGALARIERCEWVEELELRARPGDAVDRFDNGRAALGHALLVADSADDVRERVAEVRRRLPLVARPVAALHDSVNAR